MKNLKNPIYNWAKDDRPREKLISKGKNSLSDAELLAILLGSGTTHKSAVDLSREVLRHANDNLNDLARCSIKDLCNITGIGPAKAVTIIAAIELGGRKGAMEARKKNRISTSADAYNLLRHRVEDLPYEEFWIVTLNRANHVINEHRISEGGLTGTVADPRRIFSIVLSDKASGLILCHNHPSGNLQPSQEDRDLTKKLKDGGKLLDITILDHVIIGEQGYFSFADQVLL